MSTEMTDIVRGGLYQHYKGQMYRVHDVVKHSETLEDLVLYECLYENVLGKMWVRPKKMFLEPVLVDSHSVPRFKFIEIECVTK